MAFGSKGVSPKGPGAPKRVAAPGATSSVGKRAPALSPSIKGITPTRSRRDYTKTMDALQGVSTPTPLGPDAPGGNNV